MAKGVRNLGKRKVRALAALVLGVLSLFVLFGLVTFPNLQSAMSYTAPVRQFCTVTFRNADDGCVEVTLLYSPYTSHCVYKNGDPQSSALLSAQEITDYLASYDINSEHPCYYPKSQEEFITFDSPKRPGHVVLSIVALFPFVFIVTAAGAIYLQKPKPVDYTEKMIQKAERMIVQHDKKMKRQNEENIKEMGSLRGKIEREQEKRLQFVTELSQERNERLRQYDDLRDDLERDFQRIEDHLSIKDGAQKRSASRKKAAASEATGLGSPQRALSSVTDLLKGAQDARKKQSSAVEAERKRQEAQLRKKLADRKARNRV